MLVRYYLWVISVRGYSFIKTIITENFNCIFINFILWNLNLHNTKNLNECKTHMRFKNEKNTKLKFLNRECWWKCLVHVSSIRKKRNRSFCDKIIPLRNWMKVTRFIAFLLLKILMTFIDFLISFFWAQNVLLPLIRIIVLLFVFLKWLGIFTYLVCLIIIID